MTCKPLKSLLWLCLLITFSIQVHSQSLQYVQGEVLVQVPKDVTRGKILNLLKQVNGPNVEYQIEQVTDEPMNIWKVTTDYTTTSEYALMRNLEKDVFFGACQLNHIVKKRKIPNDPEFDRLYQYINTGQNSGILDADYDAEEAWDLSTGGTTINGDEIVIAVIDDGLDDDEHEDLIDNLWVNKAEIPDNGIDDDNNGYIDDYFGYDTDSNNPNVFDEGSHAVPLFGIIGAKGNNEKGVVGVNWDVKMMVVQGGGNEASTLAAYAYPYKFRKLYNETQGQQGAFVVVTNSSFGVARRFPEDAPLWCDYYDLLGSVGILSCGATDNKPVNVDEVGDLPTTCPSDFFMGVTNLNNREEKVFQAGYGKKSIDFGAFGEDIYSTSVQNRYNTTRGTSEATAFASGLIGLMYSLDCQLIADMSLTDPVGAAMIIKETLFASLQEVSSLADITSTGGRMNMNNSMQLLSEICQDCGAIITTDVSDRTDTQVQINWDAGYSNSTNNIRWRSVGSQDWNVENGVSSPFTLTGLQSCIDYEYQIQPVCGSSDRDWGLTFNFQSEGCCVLPGDVDYVLAGSTAQFSWSSIFAAQEYLVEYRPVSEAQWTRKFISDNNYALVFEEFCSAYNVRFKTICSGEETLFSEELLVKNDCGTCSSEDYCVVPAIDNTFEWIDSVYFADDFYYSGKNEKAVSSNTNIKNFTVTQGQETDLRIVPQYQQSNTEDSFAAYIDWNQNKRFDDDEEVLRGKSSIPLTSSVSVPSDAKLGPTRMRVLMGFNTTPRGCGSTGFRFGEVEDYCVFVEEVAGECDVESGLTINNVKNNRATLKWNTNENIVSYALRYKKAAATNWIELSEIADSLFISDLTKCTDYEAQIKNICGIDTSKYSSSIFFTTLCRDNTFEITPEFASIYPNPFENIIKVSLKQSLLQGNIQVINLNGQIILSEKVEPQNTEYSFDTSNLVSGVYFIRIAEKDRAAYKKMIKI